MDACDRSDSSPRHETAAVFPKTHWSVVVNAGRIGFPETAAALEELCKTYWSPLYAYLRRKGHSPHDAEDLVQGFLVRILAREDLSDVAPDKGRFRSFLLISLRNFTIKQALHDKAIKRGGGVPQFSLDTAGAEQLCGADLSSESPDLAFDRRWWRPVLALAIQRLRSEYHARGKAALFDTLTPFLVC